ncbi:MAG TPA: glycosyltransferase family 4 protein [Acidimicrobiales bacterium]|nr:glycosyltransferase family 4 protein [Acidimicrobiales bacterium]
MRGDDDAAAEGAGRERSKVRIGFYSDATQWGGAEIVVAQLLRGLPDRFDATIVGVDQEVVTRLAAYRPGARRAVVQRPAGLRDIAGLRRLRQKIRALGLEVLHCNLSSLASCREAVLAASTIPDLRIVAVEHLPMYSRDLRSRLVKALVSRRLDRHIAVGEAVARIVESRALLRKGSVGVIYNGMPDPGPPPEPANGPRVATVGCLARLDFVKGIDVLLEAVAPLANVSVRVAGRGPDRGALEERSVGLGLDSRVEFLDWTEDSSSFLRSVDIFVLPSRAEGLPLSVIEAMLAGLPVVATDVGSVRELVRDGSTGIVVPADDVIALSEALRTLVEDSELRARYGAAARSRALAHFGAQSMLTAYEDLYDAMLDDPRCRPSVTRAGARAGRRSRARFRGLP